MLNVQHDSPVANFYYCLKQQYLFSVFSRYGVLCINDDDRNHKTLALKNGNKNTFTSVSHRAQIKFSLRAILAYNDSTVASWMRSFLIRSNFINQIDETFLSQPTICPCGLQNIAELHENDWRLCRWLLFLLRTSFPVRSSI